MAAALGLLAAAGLVPGAARAQLPNVEFGSGTPGVPAPSALGPAQGGGGVGGAGGAPEVRLNTFLDTGLGALLPSRRGDAARAYDWFGNVQLRALASDTSGGTSSRTEFQGTIRPLLGLRADAARLTGSVFYAPGFSAFAGGTDQPARIDHRFGGDMTAVIVPDRVFLNARAFGALVPALPAQRLEGDDTPLTRDQLSQSTTFVLSPYVVQPFGTVATGIAGYTWNRTERGGNSVSLAPGGLPVFVPNVLTSHTGYAAVRTGQDFGRFAAEARVNASTFEGGGVVTDGGRRGLALVEARYALTRTIAVLGEGGYENQRFGGTNPLRIDEPVWGFGVRLDPGPNTVIIARYRRRNGFESPQLEARTALGPRTTLFADYFERLGTGLLNQADLLSTVTVDELGNTVDSRTGSPTSAFGAGGTALGAAGSTTLNRIRRGGLGVTRLFGLNQVTLRYTYDRTTPVSIAPGTLGLEQEVHTGALIWTRPLTQQTTLTGTAQVGFFDVATTGSTGTNILGRAAVQHRFTERLVGTLQYQISHRSSEIRRVSGSSDSIQNTLIATLTQAF